MKRKLVLIFTVILVISIFQYFFLSRFMVRTQLVSDIIIFLSILFGFYITSFAIFASSRYVSSLYKVTDKNDKSITLLHVLVNNYRIGLFVALMTLAYMMTVEFFVKPNDLGYFSVGNYFLIPFVAFIIVNFWYCFQMLCDLTNVVMQEGKNSKS